MPIKNTLKLALTNIRRKKGSTVLSLLFLTVTLSVLLLTNALASSLNRFTEKSLANRVGCRSLFIEYNREFETEASALEKIKKLEHVTAAVPQAAYYFGGTCEELADESKNLDGEVAFFGANRDTAPDAVAGEELDDQSENVCLVPWNFRPTSSSKIGDSSPLRGEDWIGKELTFHFAEDSADPNPKEHTYRFKVIGVYDSDMSMDDDNALYLSYADVYQMTKDVTPYMVSSSDNGPHSLMVVADDYKNLDTVQGELREMGFGSTIRTSINTDFIGFISTFGYALFGSMMIVTVINIMLSSASYVKERTGEIGLLKAIGYRNSQIKTIFVVEMVLLGAVSFVVSLGVALVAADAFRGSLVVQDISWLKLELQVEWYLYLLAPLFAVVFPVVGSVLSLRRITRIQPSDALRE